MNELCDKISEGDITQDRAIIQKSQQAARMQFGIQNLQILIVRIVVDIAVCDGKDITSFEKS